MLKIITICSFFQAVKMNMNPLSSFSKLFINSSARLLVQVVTKASFCPDSLFLAVLQLSDEILCSCQGNKFQDLETFCV